MYIRLSGDATPSGGYIVLRILSGNKEHYIVARTEWKVHFCATVATDHFTTSTNQFSGGGTSKFNKAYYQTKGEKKRGNRRIETVILWQ